MPKPSSTRAAAAVRQELERALAQLQEVSAQLQAARAEAEAARAEAEAARAESQRACAQLDGARVEIKLLREKLDLLLRKIYGASSEKLDPTQLLLAGLGEAPGKAPEPVVAEAPRCSPDPSPPSASKRGPRLPEHLPVVEEIIDPEPVKACPQAWRQIGQEVTEQLDYEPARFFKRRLVRRKYVQIAQPFAAPIIAALDTLQDRCLAAPGLIAAIIVGKYVDHLPLYRQGQIFATRHDVKIPRQSMMQWLGMAANWLRPIYEQIRTGVLGGGYMQIDETPIEYLEPGHGQTKLGYFWTCARPGGDTVFAWQTSRAASCLEKIVPAHWQGTVQSDGYGAYAAFVRAHNARAGQEAITLTGCWAHARRALLEGQDNAPRVVGWLLRQIAHLYALEKQLRESGAGPALRAAHRAAHSAMILRRVQAALRLVRARYLPQSALGRAITYVLEQWPGLERFLADGRLEIDNNTVENAIRPTAVGKKNWLFIGAAEAGQRGAIFYTIVESCRRRGIDPLAYMRDVLTRLPKTNSSQVATLTPEAWAKAQHQPPAAAAA
jgi:transposase